MAWYDMIGCDMIWYDICYDVLWYDMIYVIICYDMIWYMLWYVMILYDICYDMIWYMIYDMIWYDMMIYYIHTEKYSPKSCVVNFDTQMSSSQSEEWTMVFTREKNDTSNQNRERCFFTWAKNNTSNQKPHRCVSFAPKFPLFLAACWAPLRRHSRRKVSLKQFFLVKKVKNISEMEWIKVNHTIPKKTKRQV